MPDDTLSPAGPGAQSVLVVGGVSWDSVIRVAALPSANPQTLFSRESYDNVGSTGAGKALNLHRLGLEVTLHCLLGADAAGDQARAALAQEGLRFLVETDPKGTERHTNLIADNGDRLSIYTHYASFEPQVDLARLETEASAHAAVVLNIANYARRLIPFLKRRAKPIWCDVHDWDGEADYHRDFVAAADYLFMSSERLPAYAETMRRLMAESGRQLIVCTHGAKGASALTAAGEWIEVAPVAVAEVVDSNGAGDAFMSGAMLGLLSGMDVRQSLALAARAGAFCVGQRGVALSAEDGRTLHAH